MLLHTTPQEEGEHRVRQVETRQRKNKKTETKQKTNKETVPGRSLVYVMVVSLSHASRSFPKIFVPVRTQKEWRTKVNCRNVKKTNIAEL